MLELVTEETKERLLELKLELETTLKEGKRIAGEITALGFNISINPDNTTFIYKQHLESFGERHTDPSMNGSIQTPPQLRRV